MAKPIIAPSKNKLKDSGAFALQFSLSEGVTDDTNGKDGKPKHEIVLTALQEGPGNQRDRRWYTREAVINAESLFRARKKLFVNHLNEDAQPGSDDLRNWCATLRYTCIETYGTTGRAARKVRLKIHEEWLWNRCLEAPEEIALSIEGSGAGKEAVIEGQKYMVIEKIWSLSATKFVTYPGNAKMGTDLVEGEAAESLEEMSMDYKALTLALLKENRPDLFIEIETAVVAPLKTKLVEAEHRLTEAPKPGAEDIKSAIESALKPIKESFTVTVADLSAKLKESERKLDGYEIREAVRGRKLMVDQKISESKLPAQAKTPRFLERCYALVERKAMKDGKEIVVSVDEQVDAEIAEQLKLVTEDFGSVIQGTKRTESGEKLTEDEQQVVFNHTVLKIGPSLEEFRAEKAKVTSEKK